VIILMPEMSPFSDEFSKAWAGGLTDGLSMPTRRAGGLPLSLTVFGGRHAMKWPGVWAFWCTPRGMSKGFRLTFWRDPSRSVVDVEGLRPVETQLES
jgi:hypothetical protein